MEDGRKHIGATLHALLHANNRELTVSLNPALIDSSFHGYVASVAPDDVPRIADDPIIGFVCISVADDDDGMVGVRRVTDPNEDTRPAQL